MSILPLSENCMHVRLFPDLTRVNHKLMNDHQSNTLTPANREYERIFF